MSRKYIAQVDNQNFVYPNNNLAEYDQEIIHDLNENSVSGTVNSFSASFSGSDILINYNITWNKNNAEVYINNANLLNVWSIHMMAPNRLYFKPWRCVETYSSTGITATTITSTGSFTVTPSEMGLSSFVDGTYNFEVRLIGHRAIYPICVSLDILHPTPTPTPTPTHSTPTPTPTIVITNTPTPTPTPQNLYSGATLNVTDTGYIKYSDGAGGSTYKYIGSTGTYVLTDCTVCATIAPGIPFADVAAFTITNCGNPCSVGPTPTPSSAPAYYYYTGLLCGGSILNSFRSIDPNLADHCSVVMAYCDACGGTVQCFDNISPTSTINYNDVIECYGDCSTCNSDLTTCAEYRISNDSSITVSWSAFNCGGGPVSGYVSPGSIGYTGCIIVGTLTYSGTPTVTVSAYC